MPKYVFINRDWKFIRKLILEIRQYEYDNQFELKGFADQKPISKDGFYLECNQECFFLCYCYPSRVILRIMKVDRYDNVPKDGWTRERKKG
jgi:hypothetical protein